MRLSSHGGPGLCAALALLTVVAALPEQCGPDGPYPPVVHGTVATGVLWALDRPTLALPVDPAALYLPRNLMDVRVVGVVLARQQMRGTTPAGRLTCGGFLWLRPIAWAHGLAETAFVDTPLHTPASTSARLWPVSESDRQAIRDGQVVSVDWRRQPSEQPVWPLLVGDERLADAMAKGAKMSHAERCMVDDHRAVVRSYEVVWTTAGELGIFGLHHDRLRLWTAPKGSQAASSENNPPGRWRQADKLKWASKELFRALPGGKTWWFVTSSQALWAAPMQGKVDREVTKARDLGKERLATLIDRDLNRSFIFGDGWYLDLGDEAKLVKEPKARWPRPAKDAPDIERLRVYRSWVDRK